MAITESLKARANSQCELCSSADQLDAYNLSPDDNETVEQSVLLCNTCRDLIETNPLDNTEHWRCLNDSMWSPEPAVQVLAWRLLNQLKEENWAASLFEMLYLEDDVLQWAQSATANTDDDEPVVRDSNGALLANGDTVTLIKDLVVKGANFTAKRGTSVKNIRLTDNPKHIEGKVNGTQIVLVAAFLKKA